ncbi:hypothetical protein MYX04_15005, partial [Nitrospiraceae bacterium AH_259_D15_M11_P09]|nr:hypothetical protein [Nitrospiraceae bacterium AH_259_D15_M11_P09]
KFDFDYYASVHMQMAKDRLAEFGLRGIGITKGTSTLDGEPAPALPAAIPHGRTDRIERERSSRPI